LKKKSQRKAKPARQLAPKTAPKAVTAAPAAPAVAVPPPVNRGGQPKLPPIPAIYYTMGQCAADTGIPMEMLSRARAMGCQAFRSGRVEMRALLRFLPQLVGAPVPGAAAAPGEQGTLELEPATALTARAELDVWKARRERMRCLADEGRLIDRDEVRACMAAGMAEFFAMGARLFGSELPPKLAGLDELEIRSKVMATMEELKDTFRQRMEQLHAEGKAKQQERQTDEQTNRQ
jgi:hypothetical protein